MADENLHFRGTPIFSSATITGESLSEALIFASTNPQHEDRLFIELKVQYMRISSSEHGENMLCTNIVLNVRNNFCTQNPQVWAYNFMYWTCNSMSNMSSLCGLVDAKIRASDKDSPVKRQQQQKNWWYKEFVNIRKYFFIKSCDELLI